MERPSIQVPNIATSAQLRTWKDGLSNFNCGQDTCGRKDGRGDAPSISIEEDGSPRRKLTFRLPATCFTFLCAQCGIERGRSIGLHSRLSGSHAPKLYVAEQEMPERVQIYATEAAVELARQHGLYSVAYPPRLDYVQRRTLLGRVTKLQKKTTKPAFVEPIAGIRRRCRSV